MTKRIEDKNKKNKNKNKNNNNNNNKAIIRAGQAALAAKKILGHDLCYSYILCYKVIYQCNHSSWLKVVGKY
jgi:hypothetical protein